MRSQLRLNAAAIERNVAVLDRAAGGAQVCAVVKADGYGHGMVPAARAALAGGATMLAVAGAGEGAALRSALPDAPILVLGSLDADEIPLAVGARLELTAWTTAFADAVAAESARQDVVTPIHVKLDTGLGRLGTRDPREADAVADRAAAAGALRLAAGWTHLATADERGDRFFGQQLERFRAWGEPLRDRHPGVLLHAANSAAVLRDPASHFDLVRCGVAIYGLDPFGEDPAAHGLEPAMALTAAVGAVKRCAAGESAGYGRRFIAEQDTVLATIPVGYGDGYRRALTNRAEVAIGGTRHPVRGTVSMDNITVDVGPAAVAPGDTVELLGGAGPSAEELARAIDTINYEITCGFTARPERLWHRDGVPLEA